MGRIGSFVFGMIVGGAAVLGALKYHVLRTDKGFEFVPKLSATFSDTYLDVAEFGSSDWSKHKSVMAALVKADKTDVLKESASSSIVESVGGMLHELGFSHEGS